MKTITIFKVLSWCIILLVSSVFIGGLLTAPSTTGNITGIFTLVALLVATVKTRFLTKLKRK